MVGGQSHRGVGVAHRFGQAGGARAEDENGLVDRGRPAGLDRAPAVVEGVGRLVVEVGHPSGAQVFGQKGRPVAVGHRVDRFGQIDGVAHLGRLPRRAQKDDRRPELAGGVDGHDELDPVGHHQGHPVTPTDALRGQMTGQCVAPLVELAERPPFFPAQDGVALPEALSGSEESRVDRGCWHWKHSSLN